jgi:hypothetical protein
LFRVGAQVRCAHKVAAPRRRGKLLEYATAALLAEVVDLQRLRCLQRLFLNGFDD